MGSNIRDLADAYLVAKDLGDPEDRQLAQDTFWSAFIAEGRRMAMLGPVDGLGGAEAPQAGSSYPGLEAIDFEDALKAAGYLDVEMAWKKWGMDTLSEWALPERQAKMKLIADLIPNRTPTEQSVSNVIRGGFAEEVNVARCPRCGTSGKEMHTKVGNKLFYKCGNAECRRPNGKETLWDETNWQKVKAE